MRNRFAFLLRLARTLAPRFAGVFTPNTEKAAEAAGGPSALLNTPLKQGVNDIDRPLEKNVIRPKLMRSRNESCKMREFGIKFGHARGSRARPVCAKQNLRLAYYLLDL